MKNNIVKALLSITLTLFFFGTSNIRVIGEGSDISHLTFSNNIMPGDCILFDQQNDHVYDHVGFVTGVDSVVSPVYGYRDYKVAQHSSNYNAWTTSSTNHWEDMEDGTCVYLRVRY